MQQSASAYGDHPVFNPLRLHLVTPAMGRLREDLLRWLWTGSTGGLILGASQVGKTTALLALLTQLYTRDKRRIPAYYVSSPRRDQTTILSVFRQLCWSQDLPVKKNDRADHLSDRFVHYLADQAIEHHCPMTVLFVDEMQRLALRQFEAFAEVYDRLSLFDIALTTVFAGNDQQCDGLLERIEKPRYAHIRGRFFRQVLTYKGLTSRGEVDACLAQYDQLRYPDDGPTYCEYFLPEAFGAGWRLASLSTDLWRVFRNYQKTYRLGSWPMKYFTIAVNTLLADFLPRDGVAHVDEEMLRECIELSGLLPSLVHASS